MDVGHESKGPHMLCVINEDGILCCDRKNDPIGKREAIFLPFMQSKSGRTEFDGMTELVLRR